MPTMEFASLIVPVLPGEPQHPIFFGTHLNHPSEDICISCDTPPLVINLCYLHPAPQPSPSLRYEWLHLVALPRSWE